MLLTIFSLSDSPALLKASAVGTITPLNFFIIYNY